MCRPQGLPPLFCRGSPYGRIFFAFSGNPKIRIFGIPKNVFFLPNFPKYGKIAFLLGKSRTLMLYLNDFGDFTKNVQNGPGPPPQGSPRGLPQGPPQGSPMAARGLPRGLPHGLRPLLPGGPHGARGGGQASHGAPPGPPPGLPHGRPGPSQVPPPWPAPPPPGRPPWRPGGARGGQGRPCPRRGPGGRPWDLTR